MDRLSGFTFTLFSWNSLLRKKKKKKKAYFLETWRSKWIEYPTEVYATEYASINLLDRIRNDI